MTDPTASAAAWMGPWTQAMAPLMNAMRATTPASPQPADAPSKIEEDFAALNATWKESIEKWTQLAREGVNPAAMSVDALRAIFVPDHWSRAGAGTFDAGLREVLEGPRYATLWGMDREALQLQQRAAERDKRALAFQAIVQKAWNSAFERFAKSLAGGAGDAPTTWRGLTDKWLAVANETLIEAHRTDEFVQAQSSMLRAASEYRLQERQMAESWCVAMHLPTRTEMDEMQRVVTELRRELRLLRRQAASPVASKATAPAKVNAKPAAPKPRAAATAKPRRATKARGLS